MRFGRAVVVAIIVALFAGATESSASAPVAVLGSRAYAGAQGAGWGTSRPVELFNGGDPSGLVSHIRWSSWGGAVATGEGKNAIFKPQGGYYVQLVTIQLRAVSRGRCTTHGPLAYRELEVREPERPGGPDGKWLSWSGSKTLCQFGF